MTTFPSNVQLLEITNTEAKLYAPMGYRELNEFITTKYAEQPISYFNNDRRLFVVTFGDRPEVRPLSVRVEL
jgi:hypothetical protein